MGAPESEFRRRFQPDYTGMQLQEVPFCTMKNYAGIDEQFKLDLICSNAPVRKRRPVVFFIHGGGFVKPIDKRQIYISMFAKELTKAGYAVVSPDYPLFDDKEQLAIAGGEAAGYAKAAEAIHYAYQFVLEHAVQWDLDASRIAIIGGSAGGWAAFYAISNYADDYCAFINCWGAPQVVPEVSEFPATLSVHGTEDALVPFSLEEAVQKAFVKKEIEHKLITLKECGHTPLNRFADFMPEILDWLKMHM